MKELVARMASFKGCLAAIKKTKRAISTQEKTKMDITRPQEKKYLSDLRF